MKVKLKIKYADLDKMTSEIRCPECGKTFAEKIPNLKPGHTRQCPHCGIQIEYAGDNVAGKIREAIDDAVK